MGLQNWWTGMTAALSGFVRPSADPTQVAGGNTAAYLPAFDYFRAYYNNTMYNRSDSRWRDYLGAYLLYRDTRPIYNPCQLLCTTYSSLIYPGFLSPDGRPLPDGVPLAIPLSADTPPELQRAVGQFWRDSNWQDGKTAFILEAAITGSVLVEVLDEIDRRAVTAEIVAAELVSDIVLDTTGNVISYALEYTAYEATANTVRSPSAARSYVYRKEVDKTSFRTYKNGKPFDYSEDGTGAEWANPYGFVPAVWLKFLLSGSAGNYGLPAITPAIPTVDDINSFLAHLIDHGHKKMAAPKLISATGTIINMLAKQKKRAASDDEFSALDLSASDRESMLLLQGPEGSTVHSLASDMDIEGPRTLTKDLIAQAERALPEITMFQEMRGMSTITGPAAARMMGDVVGKVTDVMARADNQSIKLFQMAVAIAGERANDGSWVQAQGGPLTRQQRAYLPFDLTSYEAGDLDMSIDARPIVPLTIMETLQIEQMRASLAQPAAVTEALRTGTA